jgi:hypothetical protein
MISIQECRTILERFDYNLKDDEIMQLRDFLMMIATYQIIDYKLDTDEESNIILPSGQ